jgi:hypothetical protein
MKRFCLILFVLVLALAPSVVAADELYVSEFGGIEVWIQSEPGAVITPDFNGMWTVGPGRYTSVEGQPVNTDPKWQKVVAISIPNQSMVVHVDGPIYAAWVEVICGQNLLPIPYTLEIVPDVVVVPDAVVPYIPRSHGSGQSTSEPEPIEYDWTGQEYWLWT